MSSSESHSDEYDKIFTDPLQLAVYRERNRPGGSGPLSSMRAIYRLCDHIAKLNGWVLDDYKPQVDAEITRQNEEWERERSEQIRRTNEEAYVRAARNYRKKHKHDIGDKAAEATCQTCKDKIWRQLGRPQQ